MLTGVNVLLLGGDARQLEIINKLCENNATVSICGFEQKKELPEKAISIELNKQAFAKLDALCCQLSVAMTMDMCIPFSAAKRYS